jgi:hypothetical protein
MKQSNCEEFGFAFLLRHLELENISPFLAPPCLFESTSSGPEVLEQRAGEFSPLQKNCKLFAQHCPLNYKSTEVTYLVYQKIVK